MGRRPATRRRWPGRPGRAACGRGRGRRGRARAATGRTPISSRRRWRTSWPARRSSSSSGAGRPSASSSPRRRVPPAVAAKPIVDRVRADGPLLPLLTPRARALDRRPLPRAAGPRPPGDAAAGPARAARAGRRARAGGRRSGHAPGDGGRPGRRGPAGAARTAARGRSATWPAPTAGPGCCAACGRWPRPAWSPSSGR